MATERTDKSASFLGSTEAIHGAWESDYLNPDLDQFYEAAFDRIVRALDPKPGDRVLDAGCGYGFHAVRLARRGLRVTGVDFSDVALGRARETVARFGLENFIHLEQGSLLALPFPDGTFDHVSCWGVLMHIPDLETALEELARVLRPGGRMAIGENNGRSLHVQVWERILRTAKRALGRRVPPWDWTPRGLEEWREEDGGGLMVRKLDPGFLASFLEGRGLRLVDRFSGQLTEAYTSLPLRPAKRAVYRLNRTYFDRHGPPDLALGNVFVFEKTR